MKRIGAAVAVLGLVALSVSFWNLHVAQSADAAKSSRLAAWDAPSPNLVARAEQLRRTDGPAELQRLLKEFDRGNLQLTAQGDNASAKERDKLAELEQLIDLVGQQKFCTKSRLYWHTDLETAKSAARSSGKPILSLRMLGNLTDDLSCANSRFFRVVLYSNPEVARFLRENFVMHWASFAPVPTITIDFADGRKITRTITGNSIHYVLNSDGQVLDGLPGLYGPKAFLNQLQPAVELAESLRSGGEQNQSELLTKYRDERLARWLSSWNVDVQRISEAFVRDSEPPYPRAWLEPVREIAELEKRIADIERSGNLDFWMLLGMVRSQDAALDQTSRTLMAQIQPQAEAAGHRALSKTIVESPLMRLVRNFSTSVAQDTVRNEYAMHSKIHSWLKTGPAELETFNDRVYAELFLMSRNDPWLGLSQPDVFAALPNGGLIDPR